MGGNGSGKGSTGRNRIYSDPAHENLRKRVALYRKRHAAKLADEMEEKRLLGSVDKVGAKTTGYLLWEIVDKSGQIVRVEICLVDADPPANSQRSEWLPNMPVDRLMARALKRARLDQLKKWRGEV
jgi:hypothetical protein